MTKSLSCRRYSTKMSSRQFVLSFVVMAITITGFVQCEETATIKIKTLYDVTKGVDPFVLERSVAFDVNRHDILKEVDRENKKEGKGYVDMARYSSVELKRPAHKDYQDMVVLTRDVHATDDDEEIKREGSHRNGDDIDKEMDDNSDNKNRKDKNEIRCTKLFGTVTNSSGNGCAAYTNESIILGQQRYSKLYNTVACTLSAIIFVFGLLGNILVIIVISRTRSMHTTTNCYLLSLSVADSLVLVAATLPAIPETFFRVDEWPYGRVMCSMLIFLQYLGIDSSSLSITAFTIERYIAICHPMRAHAMCTLSRAKKIIAGLWTFTILYCAPWLGLTEIQVYTIPNQDPMYRCQRRLARSSYLLLYMIDLILFYVIPLIIAIILYFLIGRILFFSRSISKNIQFTGRGMPRKVSQRRTDSRVQVVRMLVVVVVVFATLWMPYRVMVVYNSFAQQKYLDLWFLLFARTMVYINCAINPILYNIMSVKFKRAFRNYLSCWRKRESLPATSCNDMNTDVWATRRNTNNTTIRNHQQRQQPQPQQQQHPSKQDHQQQHQSPHSNSGSRRLPNTKNSSNNNTQYSEDAFFDRQRTGGSSSSLSARHKDRGSQKLMLLSSTHGQSDNMVDVHHHHHNHHNNHNHNHQSLSLKDNSSTRSSTHTLVTNNSPLLENSV